MVDPGLATCANWPGWSQNGKPNKIQWFSFSDHFPGTLPWTGLNRPSCTSISILWWFTMIWVTHIKSLDLLLKYVKSLRHLQSKSLRNWRTPNIFQFNPFLVGGWALPLWKIWKSVGRIIPNIWKIKAMFQTTNQAIN